VRDQLTSCRHRVDSVRRHEFFRRPFDIVNVLRQRLDDRQQALRVALNARVWNFQRDLNELSQSLAAHHPKHEITLLRQRIDALSQRLTSVATASQQRRSAQIDAVDRALRAVSPDSVLRRGFSLTTLKKDGAIVRSAKQVTGGEKLITRTADGTIESTADDPKQPKLFD
jgi:exodeoxyribonuclease VII large subunit